MDITPREEGDERLGAVPFSADRGLIHWAVVTVLHPDHGELLVRASGVLISQGRRKLPPCETRQGGFSLSFGAANLGPI